MRLLYSLLFTSFTLFSQGLNSENIYLHTDKTLYLPGEILWFKPYVINAATRKPAYESAVIYVEMVGKEGNPVLQAKVENKPEANGSLYIPQGVQSGVYTLKAYTLKMKEQHLFFARTIRIVNPYLDRPVQATAPDFDFQLFPEGGTLLHGVPGKIGHKLTDRQGIGRSHTLSILENGKPVARLSESNTLGMGSFMFTPNADAVYRVQAEVDGRVIAQAPLPPVQKTGVLLNARSEKERYTVRIHSTERLPLTLRYESANGAFRKQEVRFDGEGKAEISLSKNELIAGTSCLTLLNADQLPLNERVVFRPVSDTLNFQASVSAPNTGKRKEAVLTVKGGAGSRFSVAIRRADSPEDSEDIFSTLFLKKNVLGPIEQPGYYLSKACTEKDLDDLLLTQGWRKIRESAAAETRYHQIRVKFTDKETLRPLSRQNALLSVPGANTQVFPAQTDDEGIATFFVKNVYGSTQLAIKLVSNSPSHVEIIPPFAPHEKFLSPSLPEIEAKELSSLAINTQAENSYFAKERARFNASALADSIPFYGQPDTRYLLDDYTRFVLMEEVLREYVKEVWVRKSKDNYELRLLNPATNALFKESPLIIFDGIPLNDANQVIRYDPLKVKQIEVIRDVFRYGGVTYEGIVSFSTYRNMLENFKLDEATTLLNYDGLQYERVFYTPKYATEEQRQSRKPDTRTLLYWNPNASPEEALRFSTSDIGGRYLIDIQGIDTNGRPGRAKAYLAVD